MVINDMELSIVMQEPFSPSTGWPTQHNWFRVYKQPCTVPRRRLPKCTQRGHRSSVPSHIAIASNPSHIAIASVPSNIAIASDPSNIAIALDARTPPRSPTLTQNAEISARAPPDHQPKSKSRAECGGAAGGAAAATGRQPGRRAGPAHPVRPITQGRPHRLTPNPSKDQNTW